MNIKKTIITGIAISSMFAGVAFPAFAKNSDVEHAKLIHVGLNPPACTGPFTQVGESEGNVKVRASDKNGSFKVKVHVDDALANTTYVVDVRCVGQIGTLVTDEDGDGETEITLLTTPTTPFYIDISVLGGGGGAGGYGDTFISGPFTLH